MSSTLSPTSNRTLSSLSDVLIEADRAGITRKQIAMAANVSERVVGYWISGDKVPGLETARLMVQRGPRELQDLMAVWFVAGTTLRVTRGPAVDPASDPRVHAQQALHQGVDLAEEIHRSVEDGHVDEGEMASIEGQGAAVKRRIDDAISACRGIHARRLRLAGA
jgi:type II secretory pathway component PulM